MLRVAANDSPRLVRQHGHVATALNASLSNGIPVAASADLAERFGLFDHTDRSAEVADFLHANVKVGS